MARRNIFYSTAMALRNTNVSIETFFYIQVDLSKDVYAPAPTRDPETVCCFIAEEAIPRESTPKYHSAAHASKISKITPNTRRIPQLVFLSAGRLQLPELDSEEGVVELVTVQPELSSVLCSVGQDSSAE